MKTKNNLGFTLIEMSIVLVVIGVIVSAIIGGQELIQSSKVSTIITEASSYKNALQSFTEKYKYLPGDVSDEVVSEYFTGNADPIVVHGGAPTFLGNGKVDTDDGTGVDPQYEEDFFWLQLSYAGLIKERIDFNPKDNVDYRDVRDNRPETQTFKKGGYTFINNVNVLTLPNQVQSFFHVIRLGARNGNDMYFSSGIIPISIARMIDAKIDQADTPASGTFFVDIGCSEVNGGMVYNVDAADNTKCVLGFAEKDMGGFAL